jgi:hypothetical protein
MEEYWTLIKAHEVVEKISAGLRTPRPSNFVVSGPPGCGKTTLAKSIGKLWEQDGGVTIYAEGDWAVGNRAFFPLDSATSNLDVAAATVSAVSSIIAKTVDVATSAGGLASGVLNALTKMTPSIFLSNSPYYNEEELRVAGKLDMKVRRRPLLIIADNLHWWDEKSLRILNKFMRLKAKDGRNASSVSFRIIGVYTPEPYQIPLEHATFQTLRGQLFQGHISMKGISRSQLRKCLRCLGVDRRLTSNHLKTIWNCCQSNLALIKMVADSLGKGNKERLDIILDEMSPDLLQYRIRNAVVGSSATVDVLTNASVLGNRFFVEEVACVSGVAPHAIQGILERSTALHLIEFEGSNGRFTHESFKAYFFEQAKSRIEVLYGRLVSCYKKYRPGDYSLRAFCAKQAGKREDMCALYFSAAFKEIRQGLPYDKTLSTRVNGPDSVRVGKVLADAGLLQAIEQVEQCFTLVRQNEFKQALKKIPFVPRHRFLSVSLEIDYLTCICLLSTRSDTDRESAKHILDSTSVMLEYEPEIVLRLRILFLYAESLEPNGQPEVIFREIENFAISNMNVMPEIWEEYHVLLRLAPAYYDRQVAILKIREAVAFFSPVGSGPPRRIDEYYKSLNNLGSNLVATGELEEARNTLEEASSLRIQYNKFPFLQQHYVDNNYIIGELYAGRIDKMDALGEWVLIADAAEYDDLFLCNLVSLATFCGDFNTARLWLNRVESRMREAKADEVFVLYLFEMARVCLDFHTGCKEDCLQRWLGLADLAGRVPYKSGYFFKVRHSIMSEAFQSVQPGDVQGWQTFPRSPTVIASQKHLDDYYRHGFFMTVIEYWRHS